MTSQDTPKPRLRQGAMLIRGCSLAYRESGDGPSIVFIHGTLAGMDTFRRQQIWFGHRSRVLAYSRRFHPPSGPVDPAEVDTPGAGGAAHVPYALDDHAADLIALVHTLGLSKPHLVGSSYGAYVAIRACLVEPGLAASLVAAEPPMLRLLELSAEGRDAFRAFEKGGLDPARAAFRRDDLEGGVRHFFDGIRGEEGAFDSLTNLQRPDLLRFAGELRKELSTDFDLYMPPITPREMMVLRTPTLLLTGGRSPRLFHLIINHLHEAIPDSRLGTVAGADHSIHTSAPAAYNEAVWEFIAGHL